MKNAILIISSLFFSVFIHAQSLIGAWEMNHTSKSGTQLKSVVIFSDGYQVISTFEAATGKFISTNGGTWKLTGDTITEKVEFHTTNVEKVGAEVSFKVVVNDSILKAVGSELELKRIDKGLPGKLQGAWLMSGRKRDGKIQERDTSRPRKTMKILSGTRFQWIAYNTETKQFMGTGGGTYITKNGKYTENIEFFSRDDTRVGASLQFNFELVNDAWHHSGLSSKGKPIYEIWSLQK